MSTDREVLTTAPGGRYQVDVLPWEARMSLWVYTPEIIDTVEDRVLLGFTDNAWSSDKAAWLTDTLLTMVLRKYPGDKTGHGLRVLIDCANETADFREQLGIPLPALEQALEQSLQV